MPGHLDRTNEVLVLLGDNIFAKRSASQARGVVARRLEHVHTLITNTEKDLKNFEHRVLLSQNLHTETTEDGQEVVEIMEPYTSDEEESRGDSEDSDVASVSELEQRIAHMSAFLDAATPESSDDEAETQPRKHETGSHSPVVTSPADIYKLMAARAVTADSSEPHPPRDTPVVSSPLSRPYGDVVERGVAAQPARGVVERVVAAQPPARPYGNVVERGVAEQPPVLPVGAPGDAGAKKPSRFKQHLAQRRSK